LAFTQALTLSKMQVALTVASYYLHKISNFADTLIGLQNCQFW